MSTIPDSRHSVDPTAFAQAVEAGLEGLTAVSSGICPGCEECRTQNEANFSPHGCGCCGSTLAGDRYAAHARDSQNAIVHFEVCVDCLVYLANGDEPKEWGG